MIPDGVMPYLAASLAQEGPDCRVSYTGGSPAAHRDSTYVLLKDTPAEGTLQAQGTEPELSS